jgi:uncharacterized DUF497 family protein/predicted DNA binding CopG/RHH family protein
VRFDWDRDKEAVNVAKHGVDFSEAQSAFADPLLVLAADKGHSRGSRACFALAEARAAAFSLCVSLIEGTPFASSAQAIGGKAKKSMKKKTVRYTDDKGEIIGELRAIPKGELPSLDQLVGKLHQKQKVTLALDGEAIQFFKREASKRHTSYQRMIRNLVLAYARQHTG